jgi:hypothetical protein
MSITPFFSQLFHMSSSGAQAQPTAQGMNEWSLMMMTWLFLRMSRLPSTPPSIYI